LLEANTRTIYSLASGSIMFVGMYYALKAYKTEKGLYFKYDKG